MTTTLEATKACYLLIQSFLNSTPENCLNSINLDENDKIYKLDKHLHLPTLYPSSFNKELHLQTQKLVLQTYNDFINILENHHLEELSISYNGGKDCLVQLIIYFAAVYKNKIIDNNNFNPSSPLIINAVYVHTETEFDEQINFLKESVLQFGLNFTAVYTLFNEINHLNKSQILNEINTKSSGNIKCLFSQSSTLPCGFSTYLKSTNNQIKAIIVGIRRTDPYGSNLLLKQKTDTHRGWPDFLRIHPILDWHTGDVWYFIKWLERESINSNFKINYCPLYDLGYSSIGGCDNTVRNPQLTHILKNNIKSFWPAWWILDDDIERLSRVQKGKV